MLKVVSGKLVANRKSGNTAALLMDSLVNYHFMEAYKNLCVRLDFHMGRRDEKIILVSSASEKDDIKEPDVVYLEKQGIYVAVNKNSYAFPQRMITSERMKKFLEKSRQSMDYIIIDSPPMMIASDAEALALLADASLLVVRQDCAFVGDINDCIDTLQQYSKDFVGYVLNDFREGLRK